MGGVHASVWPGNTPQIDFRTDEVDYLPSPRNAIGARKAPKGFGSRGDF